MALPRPKFEAKTWEQQDKAQFVKACRECADDDDKLRELFYMACRAVITDRIKTNQLISPLIEVVSLSKHGPIIFADVLYLCDMETQAAEIKEQRDRFIRLLSFSNNRVVSDSILKERLDTDTVADASIILDRKAANTKFIKLKTRLFYKQQKYNLLREDNEGYAKLITELTADSEFDIDYMMKVIRSLIGCFNLDPNRVLDIVLECFENRPQLQQSYITLIERFFDNPLTLSQLLALKFHFYQQAGQQLRTPPSLYIATALIIDHGIITLDDIYGYLEPNDALIREYCDQELADARSQAKRAQIISTAAENKGDGKFDEHQLFMLTANNQKLGLTIALLKLGNWKMAEEMINKMPRYFATNHPGVAKSLARLIHYSIDVLYMQHTTLSPFLAQRVQPVSLPPLCRFKSCDTFEELRLKCVPMILALGSGMHHDALLITKLIRLCRGILDLKPELKDGRELVIELLEEAILPAICLVVSNAGVCEELWELFIKFPYGTRYRLYAVWKSEDTDNPQLIRTKANVLKRIKWVMKRLSKENVKVSGRQIGKLCPSNPSYLFDYILSQIQTYDNLIGPVVDSLRFLTASSYDVLVYCIIEALADPRKDRTKHDGASISPWIVSLANFCGHMVRRYNIIELPGLLQFIANQLKAERSLDLLILKEIVNKMAGIEATEEMTNEQLSALSGGELLRAECGYFNQVRNTRKTSIRLKEALLEADLVMPLCMLMAQQRHCILFQEQQHSHLKLIGKLYDQCQETLVQYGSFLSTTLSIEDYVECLPSIDKLISEFHINPDVAFFLMRPSIVHQITVKFDNKKKKGESKQSNKYYGEAWAEVTDPIVQAILPALKLKFFEDLNPRLYVTFWSLTMYDLEVPKDSYNREDERLKHQMQLLEESKEPKKKTKEIEKWRYYQIKLIEEQLKQDQHVRDIRSRLDNEKDGWFTSSTSGKLEIITQFFQHCLFPRCLFTALDALYCAKFVHMLHNLKTPSFSTLICYDRIFADISYTMCSCTENEANNYGRFLCAILEIVSRWHKDRNIFDQECAKFPGFVTKFRTDTPDQVDHVDYESYRHVCHKWHYRLTKAFIVCLDSEDYIQIRNSLLILTKILPFFPVISSFAQAIERRVENTRANEREKRPDIYALATGYAGQLKLKKPTFIAEGEFHQKDAKPNANGNSAQQQKTNTKRSTTGSSSSQNQTSKKTEEEGPTPPPVKKTSDSSNEIRDKKSKSREATPTVANGVKPHKTERIVTSTNIKVKRDVKDEQNLKPPRKSASAASSPSKDEREKDSSQKRHANSADETDSTTKKKIKTERKPEDHQNSSSHDKSRREERRAKDEERNSHKSSSTSNQKISSSNNNEKAGSGRSARERTKEEEPRSSQKKSSSSSQSKRDSERDRKGNDEQNQRPSSVMVVKTASSQIKRPRNSERDRDDSRKRKKHDD